MPDSLPPNPMRDRSDIARERRSPARGLPLLSTEPLTQAERDALRKSARAHRLLADRLDEVVALGRVDRALEAMALAVTVGEVDAGVAARLGTLR